MAVVLLIIQTARVSFAMSPPTQARLTATGAYINMAVMAVTAAGIQLWLHRYAVADLDWWRGLEESHGRMKVEF